MMAIGDGKGEGERSPRRTWGVGGVRELQYTTSTADDRFV